MEHWMVKVGGPPLSRRLLKVDEAEGICSRSFVKRHGGSFVARSCRRARGAHRGTTGRSSAPESMARRARSSRHHNIGRSASPLKIWPL